MAEQWYFSEGGTGFGPFSLPQLRQLLDAGVLQPSDLIWQAGATESRRAAEMDGLLAQPSTDDEGRRPARVVVAAAAVAVCVLVGIMGVGIYKFSRPGPSGEPETRAAKADVPAPEPVATAPPAGDSPIQSVPEQRAPGAGAKLEAKTGPEKERKTKPSPPSTTAPRVELKGAPAPAVLEFPPLASFTGSLRASVVEKSKGVKIVEGRGGEAAQFEGKGFIRLKGDYPAGKAPRSLAVWIKDTRGPVDELVHVLQYGPLLATKTFGIIEANRKWRFFDIGGGLDSGVTVDTAWHHHCISYDGKSIRYYFDGKQVAEVERELATVSRPLLLGAHYELGEGKEGRGFVGLIADFVIYDRALNASQVKTLMTR